MPTLAIERRWTSGSAWAGIKATITYTVNNSSPTQTTISASTANNFTVAKTQSGSGVALTEAKQLRLNGLTQGLTYSFNCTARDGSNKEVFSTTITCTGSSVDSENIIYGQKSGSYSYTKTHSAQRKGCWVRLSGVEHVDANFTVNAKTSYTITYNKNGGSTPSPSSQTKWYGESATISSTTTRNDYTFLGWNTNQSATTATYKNGDIYTGNANLPLYAIWKDNYTTPQLTIKSISRCDHSGNLDEETGNYAKVTFSWKIYHNKNNDNHPTFKVKINNNTITSSDNTSNKYSGETSIVHTNISLSTENSYEVEVSIYDTYRGNNGNGVIVTKKIFLPSVEYLIDIKSSGNGIAFGGVANKDNTMQIYYNAEFNGAINYGNNPPFLWKNLVSSDYSTTLAADEGKVYIFPNTITMPEKDGYTRLVLPRTSNTQAVATGYNIDSNNNINVYLKNLRSQSSTVLVRAVLIYLKDDLKWT